MAFRVGTNMYRPYRYIRYLLSLSVVVITGTAISVELLHPKPNAVIHLKQVLVSSVINTSGTGALSFLNGAAEVQ